MLHIKSIFLARLKENIAWNVIKNLYLTWTAAGGQEQIENKGGFLQHLQLIIVLNSSYERKPSFSSCTQGKPRFRTNHEALRVLIQLPSTSFSFALLKKLIHVYVVIIILKILYFSYFLGEQSQKTDQTF